MPRLNAFRFGHIEYNYGQSVITDETIDLYQESSLLRMENGGGKSVLVQLLLSPYLSGRNRNFPKRPFSDYFRTNKPSFILEEWVLDNEAGYFLIGAMVRKKQSISTKEEDGAEDQRLDFYIFISEYKEESFPGSIQSLQVTKDDEERKVYLSYSEAKKQLEDLAKRYPSQFRLYNMNNSSHRQAYMERLHEFNLESSEWEQMRTFNLDESGLSDFTSRHNTDEKLVSQVFLPAIERKLNQKADVHKMDTLRETVKSYLIMRLDNEEIYTKKRDREEMLNAFLDLQEPANILESHNQKRLQELERLESVSQGLRLARQNLDQKIRQQEELQKDSEEKKIDIQIEEQSQAYYQILDELEAATQEYNRLKNEEEALRKERDTKERKLELERIAQIYLEIQEEKAKQIGYQTRLKALQQGEKEILKDVGKLANTLYQDLQVKLEKLNQALQSLQEEVQQVQTHQKDLQKERKEHEGVLGKMNTQIGRNEQVLSTYETLEKNFEKKWNLSIEHSLSFYQDEAVFYALKEKAKQQVQDLESKQERLVQNIESLSHQIEQTIQKQGELQTSKIELKSQIEKAQAACKQDQNILEYKQTLCEKWRISSEKALEDQVLQEFGEKLVNQYNTDLAASQERSLILKAEKHNLETGCKLDLTEAMEKVFEDMGIPIQSGFEYLKKRRMGPKAKQKLLQEHPLLPYSLVVGQNQLEPLLTTLKAKNLYTSSILSFITPESLKTSKSESLVSKGVEFYFLFNEKLIDEEEWKRKLNALKAQQENEKANRLSLQQALSKIHGDLAYLKAHPLNPKDVKQRQRDLERLNKESLELNTKQAKLEGKLASQKRDQNKLNLEQKKVERALGEKRVFLEATSSLVESYLQAAQSYLQKEEDQKKKDTIVSALRSLENEQDRLGTLIDQLQEKRIETQSRINLFENESAQYRPYTTKTLGLAKGDIEHLKAKFNSLRIKLDASEIPQINEELAKTQKNLQQKESKLKQYKSLYEIKTDEKWMELLNTTFNIYQDEKEVRELSNKVEKAIKVLGKQEAKTSRLEERIKQIIQAIEKLKPNAKPKERYQTRTISLKEELAKVEKIIQNSKRDVRELNDKMNGFERVRQKANVILENSSAKFLNISPFPNMSELSLDSVKEMVDTLEQSLKTFKRAMDSLESNLNKDINKMAQTCREKEDQEIYGAAMALKDSLEDPKEFKSQLNHKINLLQTFLEKAELELTNVEKAGIRATNFLFDYLKEVDDEMRKIGSDTRINLRGQSRKMLQITLPKWDEVKEEYLEKTRAYLQELISQIKEKGNQADAIDRVLIHSLNTEILYNRVIGWHTPNIQIYKIEENRETQISWQNAGKTSGAESFLAAFTVVSALLSYQRQNDSDIYASKQSSVMIMDNPFAKVHSAHIIQPLLEMCQAQNIQFIAFSAVDNAAILNAFKVIYSLRMVPRVDGKNHLFIESLKDNFRQLETLSLRFEYKEMEGEEESEE